MTNNNPKFLGVDTSNYATSAAVFLPAQARYAAKKAPLKVQSGEMGLRQSDAVFLHLRNLPGLLEQLNELEPLRDISAIGVSAKPKGQKDSYMPCFVTGETLAAAIATTLGVPLFRFTHQAGHIAAALFGSGAAAPLSAAPFLAFHVSGGTTDALRCDFSAAADCKIEPLAQSLDLYAGQAVDRVGAMLGLEFPAGPELSALAEQCAGELPAIKPVLREADCSLSGLQNQCEKLFVQKQPAEFIARYCLMFIAKTILAMIAALRATWGALPVLLSGGVMSSSVIQREIKSAIADAYFCEPALSSDNAVGAALLAAAQRGYRFDG